MTFQKGHKLATGRPKGSKNLTTIAQEERRAIFEAEVSQVFVEKIHEARPEYILDQFIGKTPDLHVNLNVDAKPNERAKELANRLLGIHG